MRDVIHILGVRVDNLTPPEALERIQGFIENGSPHQVVTVNPEFLVMAQKNGPFRQVLNSAALALPDGVGLLLASRFLGVPLKGRVTGVDTVKRLASLAAERGYRLFLLGAAEGVAERAGNKLKGEFPSLVIVGTYAGTPDPREEDKIVTMVRETAPHILFVAYGAPQQDLWINRNLNLLGVPVCMGVGGALDFISGTVKRAPGWMRRLGLEWLFRLIQEPWRWRRMLRLPEFLLLVLLSRLSSGG